MNSNKASGPDLIPARVLKELAIEIAPFLQLIFQKCLSSGVVPKDWKTAHVSAILRKGEI